MRIGKLSKKVVLSAVLLCALAGGYGVHLASASNSPVQQPKQLLSVDVPATKPVEVTGTSQQATEQNAATPAKTIDPVTPPAPTPEENKEKIMNYIADYVNKNWSGANPKYEQYCFDRYFTNMFTSNDRYNDYDSLVNDSLLQEHASGKMRWLDMTCRIGTYNS